jgi:bifunctional N-acetylglucosamine-1-phosphate-uridyltransferase/glucosamine-1-phosphate-acetyltransferase GlmU-like protein
VPAAGKGTRLNAPGPKILYPVLGKPILEWLAQLLTPLCRDLVFVLSPDALPQVEPVLKSSLGGRARTVVQDRPTGMADAVALCEKAVVTPYTLVIWGDQVTTSARTLAACMTLLESSSSIQATIPTIERDNPYIHFVRDAGGRITDVFHARESDAPLARGENDCGVFLFRTEALFRVLKQTRGNPAYQGAKTKENNFLSVLPLFNDDRRLLATVRIHDAGETIGINTPDDAQAASRVLKSRTA